MFIPDVLRICFFQIGVEGLVVIPGNQYGTPVSKEVDDRNLGRIEVLEFVHDDLLICWDLVAISREVLA
jgi:hypothetical protein